MTKKRYANTTDLSRSATAGARRRRRPGRLDESGSSSGAFEALQPESEEHPVDVVVDRIPLIARLSRDLIRQADRLMQQVHNRAEFVAYEDLRLHLRSEREIAYFNLGYEHGLLRGRAEAFWRRAPHDEAMRSFAKAVTVAELKANLGPRRTAAVLLGMAYAQVLQLRTKGKDGAAPARRRGAGSPPVSS